MINIDPIRVRAVANVLRQEGIGHAQIADWLDQFASLAEVVLPGDAEKIAKAHAVSSMREEKMFLSRTYFLADTRARDAAMNADRDRAKLLDIARIQAAQIEDLKRELSEATGETALRDEVADLKQSLAAALAKVEQTRTNWRRYWARANADAAECRRLRDLAVESLRKRTAQLLATEDFISSLTQGINLFRRFVSGADYDKCGLAAWEKKIGPKVPQDEVKWD